MELDVEQTLLMRDSKRAKRLAESEYRRRSIASASVFVELEKEFGPANRTMAPVQKIEARQ